MNEVERFSFWILPDQIKGNTFLDIGCRDGVAGEYVMANGAKSYLGIDIDIIDNINLKNYPTASVQQISAEDFLETCDMQFDFVLMGNVLFEFSDGIHILKRIVKISKNIIIESASPTLPAVILDSSNPDYLKKMYELEYNHAYMEVFSTSSNHWWNRIKEDRHLGFIYNIGFLKTTLNRLGFVEDLSSYESLKILYPEHYGIGSDNTSTKIKKFIIKFKLVNESYPLTRAEWHRHTNV